MSSKTKATATKEETAAALVPKLRFPEFRGARDWEQKYIEDFFNVGSSKRVLQQDWIAQGIPFYRTRELVSLSKNEPFSSEIFISKSLFNEITQKYGAPQEGDFLVSGVGTLGISYLVKKNDEFYFKDGNVLWLSRKGGVSSSFFKYCFESDVIQDQILKQASVSTVGTYTIQNAKITKFYCPPTENEQQKVAECLSSVDELTAAQARKLDALKAHKKGLMQQIFPREGETQPRLRFPEFQNTGEWEAIELGEKVDLLSGYPFDGPDISQDSSGVPLLRGINVTEGRIRHNPEIDRYYTGSTEGLEKFRIQADDLVIGMDGSKVGRNSALVSEADAGALLIQRVARLRAKKASLIQFIFQRIHSPAFHAYVDRINTSSGIPHISAKQIKEFRICFPSPAEQQPIASCLTSLDTLITAETQKLEALKTHKNGLMQQLFPSMEAAEA